MTSVPLSRGATDRGAGGPFRKLRGVVIAQTKELKASLIMGRAKTALLILVIVCSVLSHANPADTRIVRGKVVTSDGKPLLGAVVQLKNLVTLSIRSYVTQRDGKFEFSQVDSDQAYEVRAHYGDHWGDTNTITRFDSSKVVDVTLTVDVTK